MNNAFLKALRTVEIVVIGIFADNDIRVCDHIFDKTQAYNIAVREDSVGIGSDNNNSSLIFIRKFLDKPIEIVFVLL